MKAVLRVCVLMVAFSLSASAAHAGTVEDATVNIYCVFETGRKAYSSTGTGVLVSDRGVILTNAHVAQSLLAELVPTKKSKGGCTVRTGSPARDRYDAALLYLSESWVRQNLKETDSKHPRGSGEGDFALLYIPEAAAGSLPKFPYLPISSSEVLKTLEGSTVEVAGYPAEALDFKGVNRRLKYVENRVPVNGIRSFEHGRPDVIMLAPSKVAAGGVSGGPVVGSDGSVIGIATAVETGKAGKDGRSMRAITLSYIDRTLQENTRASLASLVSGDLATRSAATLSTFGEKLRKDVGRALFQLR